MINNVFLKYNDKELRRREILRCTNRINNINMYMIKFKIVVRR